MLYTCIYEYTYVGCNLYYVSDPTLVVEQWLKEIKLCFRILLEQDTSKGQARLYVWTLLKRDTRQVKFLTWRCSSKVQAKYKQSFWEEISEDLALTRKSCSDEMAI